jgi:hypothetical protein
MHLGRDNGLVAIARLRHNVKSLIAIQHAADTRPHKIVVVDHEDAKH